MRYFLLYCGLLVAVIGAPVADDEPEKQLSKRCVNQNCNSCDNCNNNYCSDSTCCSSLQCNDCVDTCHQECSSSSCRSSCVNNCANPPSECRTAQCHSCYNTCNNRCSTSTCSNNCIQECTQRQNNCNGGNCNAGCNNNNCNNNCRHNCDETEPVKVVIPLPEVPIVEEKEDCEDVLVENRNTSIIIMNNSSNPVENLVNITTLINIQNIVNNTNVISIPVYLNSTNVNHINLQGGDIQKDVEIVNSSKVEELENNCCFVIHPRHCYVFNNTDGEETIKCIRRRHKECSAICTSQVVLIHQVPVRIPQIYIQPVPVPQPPKHIYHNQQVPVPISVPVPVVRPVPVPVSHLVPVPVAHPVSVARPVPVIHPVRPISVVPPVPPVPVVPPVPFPHYQQKCHYINHYPWVYCGNYQTQDCGSCYYCGGIYQPRQCSKGGGCSQVCQNNMFYGRTGQSINCIPDQRNVQCV